MANTQNQTQNENEKEKKKIYMQNYRKENRDKFAEYRRRYYQKNKEKFRQYRRKSYAVKKAERMALGICFLCKQKKENPERLYCRSCTRKMIDRYNGRKPKELRIRNEVFPGYKDKETEKKRKLHQKSYYQKRKELALKEKKCVKCYGHIEKEGSLHCNQCLERMNKTTKTIIKLAKEYGT